MKNTTLLPGQGRVTPEIVVRTVKMVGTPNRLSDESLILHNCDEFLRIPNAFGMIIRYAMKANSLEALLQLIASKGLHIDASSINEVWRAHRAGFPYDHIMYTSQQIPLTNREKLELEDMVKQGVKFTVCSIPHMEFIADFAAANKIAVAVRRHPKEGSGESVTRDTGSPYSPYGAHPSDIPIILEISRAKHVIIDELHGHIGSGSDPKKFKEFVPGHLRFIEEFGMEDVTKVNFGGGYKEGRMPDEIPADINDLGEYAKSEIEAFYKRTGRKLVMELEPGTRIVANSGYTILTAMYLKQNGPGGCKFVVCNGGMELVTRPLLYGSRHPLYGVSREGELISSEFNLGSLTLEKDGKVVTGRCCESGDALRLDKDGNVVMVVMGNIRARDHIVVGGTGAYCSSMSLKNYNSYLEPPEVLVRIDGDLDLIKKGQTREQMVQNELPLRKLN